MLTVDSVARAFPADRGTGTLRGIVRDATGRAVPDLLVTWLPRPGFFPPGLSMRDDRGDGGAVRTGSDGRFLMLSVPCGPVLVEARRGESVARAEEIVGAEEISLVITLRPLAEPGDDLRIHVVDALGEPVAAAEVEVFAWSWRATDVDAAERSRTVPLHRGSTDETGTLRVVGEGIDTGVIVARSADGAAFGNIPLSNARTGSWDVEVRLAPPGRVRGRLTGLMVDSLRGATLALHQLGAWDPYYTSGGRRIDVALDGASFAVDALPAGRYGVTLDAPALEPGGVRLVTRASSWGADPLENSIEMPTFEVRSGETADVDLAITAGGSIRGQVLCGGRPVAGARVQAVMAPRTSNYPDGFVVYGVPVWRLDLNYENAPHNPTSHRLMRTDSAGRYDLNGLAPGRWRVEITSSSLSYDCRDGVAIDDGKSVELRHELSEAGVLQVATLDTGWIGVVRVGASGPVMLAVTRQQFATFPGLAAGEYTVAGFHSDERVPPVPVAQVTVVAGRTTWADLREQSVRCVIRGVVTGGQRSAEGAVVSLYPQHATTRADGSFTLRLGHPVWFREGRGATLEVGWQGGRYAFAPRVGDPVTDVDLPLRLGDHEVEFELVDTLGRPVAGSLDVFWKPADGATSDLRTATFESRIGDKGRIRIGPLPSGSLSGTIGIVEGIRLPISIGVPRTEPARFVIPARAKLEVRVVRAGKPVELARVAAGTLLGDAEPPADFDALGERALWSNGRTDKDGRVSLEVASGEVLVRAGTGGFLGVFSTPRRVSVGPDSVVAVELSID